MKKLIKPFAGKRCFYYIIVTLENAIGYYLDWMV